MDGWADLAPLGASVRCAGLYSNRAATASSVQPYRSPKLRARVRVRMRLFAESATDTALTSSSVTSLPSSLLEVYSEGRVTYEGILCLRLQFCSPRAADPLYALAPGFRVPLRAILATMPVHSAGEPARWASTPPATLRGAIEHGNSFAWLPVHGTLSYAESRRI